MWQSVNRLTMRRLNAESRQRHTADRRAYDAARYQANREAFIARNRRYDARQAAERERLGTMLTHLSGRLGCPFILGVGRLRVRYQNGQRHIERA